MKKRYFIYFLLIAGLAYLIFYRIGENKKIEGPGKGGSKKDKKGDGPALNVEGVIVKTSSFTNNLELTGSIEPNEAVSLQSEVSGLVTGIYFTEGSSVAKGTLLVKINDKDIQAQIKDINTKEKLAATNEDRAKQLLQKGAISQEEYDTSLADLQSIRAQTQVLKAQLAKTSIYAPFSGKIGLRSISLGEYLTPNKIIANLLSTNPVKISFSLPERYASQIKNNTPIKFTIDASHKTFEGRVFAIEPGINQQTRTLNVKALARNDKNELVPGSFAKVSLDLQTISNAILIPTEAIIPILDGKMVYTVKDGKAQKVNVEAGTRTATSILIQSGLNVGDTVLTTGAMAVKQGSSVKVKVVN
ncbi:efflux RND transporter periplasmic adaptor subunit [Pedobacter montanisoli]|uniref:Efflux RND transporter periplasmic adaptor subunit n=1 Tax=Pedobacter montanisoli TaxID=2923277 RepID=A0ABS9ZT80_9SPHI|nr:efflux RND transporter periplasmic adaptor subunit [Pedobacter montanisoli]MCJ0741427.1 efflux RND transporter periplasmic adaptor subunit [Pedobacter montanisoli]